MKPFLEKVVTADDASWTMLNRRLDEGIPFEWHHHPEYELTMTLNSRGQRFVGDHIGSYDDGDLVLLGPDLPHTWSGSQKIIESVPHIALVMWFKPAWAQGLTSVLRELGGVADMLGRARGGLRFSDEAAKGVRSDIETLFALPPAVRALQFVDILSRLSRDGSAQVLATPVIADPSEGADRGRIDRVLDYVHAHYSAPLKMAELAEVAALSTSGFHRLFRRHTRHTPTHYIARLRIGEACALLTTSDAPIAHIADVVGYGALANFNRQFLAIKGMTPRAFRRSFRG